MADERVTLPVVSAAGTRVGEVDVPATLLAGPVRQHLLYEAVRAHQASRRLGTASTKTRAYVRGGGKKPWRQKGTGRARAGSSRSPIWAGGAVIFGPLPRDYSYQLPKTARRAALRSALAARHAEGALLVVDALTLAEAKTKRMVELLRGLKLPEKGVLLVTAAHEEAIERAARNLPRIKVVTASDLSVYDVLGHAHLVMTRDALGQVATRLDVTSARAS